MRVERRIVLTKKDLEAMKTVFEMYNENDYDLFDCADDFIEFVNDVVKYDRFQDFVIVEED